VNQSKDKDMRCSDPDEKYIKCAVKSQTVKIAWVLHLHSWAVTCNSKLTDEQILMHREIQ
jgi:hypothetical protein